MTKDATTPQRKLSQVFFMKLSGRIRWCPRTDAEDDCDEFPPKTWSHPVMAHVPLQDLFVREGEAHIYTTSLCVAKHFTDVAYNTSNSLHCCFMGK